MSTRDKVILKSPSLLCFVGLKRFQLVGDSRAKNFRTKMGNAWAACCGNEDGVVEIDNSPKEQLLLTSALRQSSLPLLQTKAGQRRESKRTVRIESLSPMIEVEDYETESEESGDAHPHPDGYDSPPPPRTPTNLSPLRPSSSSPKQSSGLRLLLTNAVLNVPTEIDQESEQKEDDRVISRALKRVERHDSLSTVLKKDDDNVLFAPVPVGAMKTSDLPKGLVFAFLDDSPVSRASFQNALKSALFGGEESFIRGTTAQEARAFADEVLIKKPDIVVLDHCLDYDYESLKGLDIAKEIRKRGFEGCIVLQSDQESLREEVDFDVVDGLTVRQRISNSSSSFAMARMVALSKKKTKMNAGLPAPSSTHSSWNSRAECSFSFDLAEKEFQKSDE